VREAERSDAPAVVALWREAAAEPTVSDNEASIVRLLDHDPQALLVAEVDGQLVGTLISGWDGWRANVYRLATVPDARRQGVATALVREAERRFRRRGALRISAIVIDTNAEAVAFWQSAGFELQPDRARLVKNLR